MLTKLTIKISYNYHEKLTYQISSLMHGIIMEHVSKDYGDILHTNGVKPFAQYITNMTDSSFVWNITTMTNEAKEKIIDVLEKQNHFWMKHKELELKVDDKKLETIMYDDLVQTYYFGQQNRYINIQFMTPTAFKSHGQYVFMPTVRHIFQSLMNKYDAVSTESSIGSAEVLEHFEQYIFIQRYQLKSVFFSLEGVRIPAFVGNITFKVNGPQQMVNLARMLVEFGKYSGVGIKSTLGMGAIDMKERVKR